LRRITHREARASAVSPDGEWLVYWSHLSRLGTRTRGCSLRVVRLDGSEERVLASLPRNWCGRRATFAPDGDRLMMYARGDDGVDVRIVSLSQANVESVAIASPGRNWSTFIEWLADGTGFLVYDHTAGYWRADVATGALSAVYRPAEGRSFSTVARSRSRAVVQEWDSRQAMLALPGDPVPAETTKVIELADGSAEEIAGLCSPEEGRRAVLSVDGRYVFYACPAEEVFTGALRRRDLTTGEETLIAELDGKVSSLGASPDRSRFMVRLANPLPPRTPRQAGDVVTNRMLYRYVLVGADGSMRPLDLGPDWRMVGWFGNDRRVLQGRVRNSSPLAYLELAGAAPQLRMLSRGGS